MTDRFDRQQEKSISTLPVVSPDGHGAQNAILSGLPRREREALNADLEYVELATHVVLNEIGQPIRHGYFVTGGLASILNVLSNGKSVEVGITGKEGFVGLSLLVGYDTSPTRAIMQIGGSGYRISAENLVARLPELPSLEKSLNRYFHEMNLQAMQIAACNRLHEVDQRLARWLLMSADRMGASEFLLTQEFLSHMLGTRRASVTVAAGILQKAGLIHYKRGRVKIENRDGLEKAACECYRQLDQQTKMWRNNISRE